MRDAIGLVARLNLFVYGTLKRGQRNNSLFGDADVEWFAARTPGRLYSAGVPFLDVGEHAGPEASFDVSRDIRKAATSLALRHPDPEAVTEWVCGEVASMSWPSPETAKAIARIDRLEGCGSDRVFSGYRRKLVWVWSDEITRPVQVWAYVTTVAGIDAKYVRHVRGGVWPETEVIAAR